MRGFQEGLGFFPTKQIPDAETAPIVRRMYEVAVQGKGYKAIGNVLKREASIFSGIAYCPDCGRRISFFPEKTSKSTPEASGVQA